MRLSDLRGAKVKTRDGKTIGRVHELETNGGKIVALACGPKSLIERLTATTKGRRVSWDCVHRINRGVVIVTSNPPQRTDASGTKARH